MKVSTSLFFDRSTNQMIKGQSELAKTQTRLSSGKEVVNPSDAPDKATAIQRIKSVLNKQESFASNIDGAENRLIAEETALKGVNDVLTRIKELSIQAANGTLGPRDKELVAIEVEGLTQDLLSLANTQDVNDNYIFQEVEFKFNLFRRIAHGDVVYFGDETRNAVQVSEQRYIRFNRTGTDVFGRVLRETDSGETVGKGFFEALGELASGIRESNTTAINQGIDDLDQASFNIAVATAQVGSEMASVNTQREVNEETVLQLRTILSNLEDLDYSKAVTQMQKDMLALQATQSSFSQISNLNLFNYIS